MCECVPDLKLDVRACLTRFLQVLARGEKIELLVDKTEALNQSARKFQHASKNLKSAMWWVNALEPSRSVTFRAFQCVQAVIVL